MYNTCSYSKRSLGCTKHGTSKRRDVKAQGCQSKGMSQQRDVKTKGCHNKGMSKQRDVKAKGCQRQGMSTPRDVNSCHFLKISSHQSFAFTSSTFTCGGTPCTNCVFESERINKILCLADKTRPARWMGRVWVCWAMVAGHPRFGADHARIGLAVKLPVRASFEVLRFERGLAPKLRFQIFNFHLLRDAWYQSFVFASSTFTKSRAKASFSHLPLTLFEGRLARTAFLKVGG